MVAGAVRKLSEGEQRRRICSAMNIDPELFPNYAKTVWLGRADEELNRDQVGVGVVAMSIVLNLSSGNSGGRNLYKLNEIYMLNNVAKDELNAVLEKYGAVIFNH